MTNPKMGGATHGSQRLGLGVAATAAMPAQAATAFRPRRRNLEQRILDQEGRHSLVDVSQADRRAQGRRAGAAGACSLSMARR
jgi:hypothetical protein